MVDGNFVVELGHWLMWLCFPWFHCGVENGSFFKELFLLFFLATKHYMEEMRLFQWLFLLIFSAFLFDFLGYQMQSSKLITFFLKFYFKEKNQRKHCLCFLFKKKGGKFKEWIFGSINGLFKILRFG